jgi:hypothetical protein
MGDIVRNNVASGMITMFFLMITHDNYKNIQYVNLMPVNSVIVPNPTMDHFEGEIV